MVTKELVIQYFDAINSGNWQSFVDETFDYVVLDTDKVMMGKEAYLKGAGQFFSMCTHVVIKEVLINKSKVSVLSRYTLNNTKNQEMLLDVSEFLTFSENNKLNASSIFFDSQKLNNFLK